MTPETWGTVSHVCGMSVSLRDAWGGAGGGNVSWSGSDSVLPEGFQSKDRIPGFSSLTPPVPDSAPGFLAV